MQNKANMTSSKSDRASNGSGSTPISVSSASSVDTANNRAANQDSGASKDKKPFPMLKLLTNQLEALHLSNGAKTPPAKAETVEPVVTVEPALLSPSTNTPRKKFTLERLTSYFPSLTSPSASDSPTSSPIHRKPLAAESPSRAGRRDLDDWGSQLQHQFGAGSTDLGASLSLDGKNGHRKHSSHGSASSMRRLQKQSAPDRAPPLPPKDVDGPALPNAMTFNIAAETRPSPKLLKKPTEPKRRSSSMSGNQKPLPRPNDTASPALAPSQMEFRGRSSSAQPSANKLDPWTAGHRHVSSTTTTVVSRPASSHGSQSPTQEGERRGRLRRSWFPGGRSRSNSQDMRAAQGSGAWILGPGQTKVDYNTAFLEKGDHVPELWNESGDILIYLHPRGSGKGPSFKVMSFVTDYSLVFNDLLEDEAKSPSSSGRSRARSFTGRGSLSVSDAARRPQSPPSPPAVPDDQLSGGSRLYVPSSPADVAATPDLDRLISIRNLFALLTGQPLVGTKAQPTIFVVLLRIADLLAEFEFTSVDGGTFGDSVDMSFGFFMEQMAVADVRYSREKTLEALLLGERLRSWELYNEAFAHAVGKYSALRDLNSPLWNQVSAQTRQRLERGHLELLSRQNNVNNRLENFDFPALFSGLANSATMYKHVKFGRWKSSFSRMRSFVLNYYKTSFGSWPPKARSKKNPFSESGLNRQVLKILYSDLCALYDLIVDRQSLTPRTVFEDNVEEEEDDSPMSALRKILTEYDQSSPPVLPPLPYDIPLLPDLKSIRENYDSLPAKAQRSLDNNYQEYEFLLIMSKSYDFETLKLKLPFLEQFEEFEKKEAKGKPISEIADQRIGYWLFLYVVIQSLPMLVVDAPGLNFTESVEYFLCQPPKGQPPWLGEASEVRKRWYEVSGGAGYVELSDDTVEFSIEGIYHRSHCWVAAKQWEAGMAGPVPEPQAMLSPLQAPQAVFEDMDPARSSSPKPVKDRNISPTGSPGVALRPRGSSPAGRPGYRSSIALGLEPVPMPGELPDRRGSRVLSAMNGPPRSRPVSVMMGRSRSSGNLHGMGMASPTAATEYSRTSSRQGSQGGSTFDDILKDVEQKPKKKKSLFG